MTKKYLVLLVLMMVMFPLSSLRVSAASIPIHLTGGYVDPTEDEDHQRSPMLIPLVEIEDYTLFFISPCDGSEFRLVDENSNVVYTTTIQKNAANLVLPSYLSGYYEIQIIQGNYYFWGYIEL